MDKRKVEKVKKLNTEAIQNILDTLSGPEAQDGPSPEYPLGGLVQISGIGQVPVKMLRQELVEREETT